MRTSVFFPSIMTVFGTTYLSLTSLKGHAYLSAHRTVIQDPPHIFLHKLIKCFREQGGTLPRIKEVQGYGPQWATEEVPEQQCICSFIDLENHFSEQLLAVKG